MADLNANLILQGQSPNMLAQYSQGRALGRQTAMENMLRQNAGGLMQGDPQALNALAAYDPAVAQRMQLARTQEARAVQSHDLATKEANMRMQGLSAEMTRKAQEYAAGLSAAERKAQADKIENALKGGAYFHKNGDKAGYENFLRQNGIDPAQYPFEQFPAIANTLMPVADILKASEPLSAQGKFEFDKRNGVLPPDAEFKGAGTSLTVNTAPTNERGLPIVDKPPKGYQRRYDAEKNSWVDEPIPGGEQAVADSDKQQALKLAQSNYDRKADIVDTALDTAIKQLDEGGRMVAGWGTYFAGLPESRARDFQATIDTVKANLGFDELQAMRDASPTGGALGQVSEREIAFLQAIQGNLDAAQSPEQLMRVLQEIKQRRAEFRAERERILSGQQTGNTQPTPGVEPLVVDGYTIEQVE